MKRLNVAIIGQGRSGRDIHGRHLLTDAERFKVAAVAELLPERRERAREEYGCEVYTDYRELFNRDDIDLVVNSTFSYLHHPITIDLLKHGLNVIVEKPFSAHVCECDEMIGVARESGAMLSVFQQSRFAPYFIKIKEILASGVLGRPVQISIRFSGFSRRWDWQCSQRFYGGSLLNTGPHPMNQALDLLEIDGMPSVFSRLDTVLTSGDAEDYVKVILTAPGRPLIDLEISSCDAFPGPLYTIQGSRGALKATHNLVEWKYFHPESEPERPLTLEPICDGEGFPAYCREDLTWQSFTQELSGTAFDTAVAKYYDNIYAHLVNGAELAIKPEKIRQQIAVIEQIHENNPLPVKY